ncbi:MAG: sulfotransferase [Planctomycetota bacterium]
MLQPISETGVPQGLLDDRNKVPSAHGEFSDHELDRPVFVTGTPRCGKSLIARALGHSPEFLWLQEPVTIWDTDFQGRVDDRRLANDQTSTTHPTIRKLCQKAVESEGKRRYVDDLAYHCLRLPFLNQAVADKRIIHVVRSGELSIPEMLYGWTHRGNLLKSAATRSRQIHWRTFPGLAKRFLKNHFSALLFGRRVTWGPRVPGLAAFSKSHSAAEVAAYQWRSLVETALDDLESIPRHQWMQVRFEDLLADPTSVVRRIAEFCEAEDPRSMIEHARTTINGNYDFPKRVAIGDREWASIRGDIAPIMKRLGYWN